MSSASRSLQVWAGYVLMLGLGLLLIPNMVFSLFGIEHTDEVWIRAAGFLLLGYGAYYATAVRAEFLPLYRVSVWVRWGIAGCLVALAFITGPWQLLLFALGDFLGGLWTFVALRSKASQQAV